MASRSPITVFTLIMAFMSLGLTETRAQTWPDGTVQSHKRGLPDRTEGIFRVVYADPRNDDKLVQNGVAFLIAKTDTSALFLAPNHTLGSEYITTTHLVSPDGIAYDLDLNRYIDGPLSVLADTDKYRPHVDTPPLDWVLVTSSFSRASIQGRSLRSRDALQLFYDKNLPRGGINLHGFRPVGCNVAGEDPRCDETKQVPAKTRIVDYEVNNVGPPPDEDARNAPYRMAEFELKMTQGWSGSAVMVDPDDEKRLVLGMVSRDPLSPDGLVRLNNLKRGVQDSNQRQERALGNRDNSDSLQAADLAIQKESLDGAIDEGSVEAAEKLFLFTNVAAPMDAIYEILRRDFVDFIGRTENNVLEGCVNGTIATGCLADYLFSGTNDWRQAQPDGYENPFVEFIDPYVIDYAQRILAVRGRPMTVLDLPTPGEMDEYNWLDVTVLAIATGIQFDARWTTGSEDDDDEFKAEWHEGRLKPVASDNNVGRLAYRAFRQAQKLENEYENRRLTGVKPPGFLGVGRDVNVKTAGTNFAQQFEEQKQHSSRALASWAMAKMDPRYTSASVEDLYVEARSAYDTTLDLLQSAGFPADTRQYEAFIDEYANAMTSLYVEAPSLNHRAAITQNAQALMVSLENAPAVDAPPPSLFDLVSLTAPIKFE